MQSHDVCDACNDRVVVVGPIRTVDIPYDWWLVSRDGAGFKLLPGPGVTDEEIEEAKACLRRNRDVVSLKVERRGV